jgi:hypothetical protein
MKNIREQFIGLQGKPVEQFRRAFELNHSKTFYLTVKKKKWFVISRWTVRGETEYSHDLSHWFKTVYELQNFLEGKKDVSRRQRSKAITN